jgi:hypothetical protein
MICRNPCAASSRVLLRRDFTLSYSTAAEMGLRIVVIKLFGLHFSSSRRNESRWLRARIFPVRHAQVRKSDFGKANTQELAVGVYPARSGFGTDSDVSFCGGVK